MTPRRTSQDAVEEVVTRALVRDVDVPVAGHDSVRVALVTLDNARDHRRPTTFGPAGLAEVERTFATLATRTDLDAVAVTGKPFVFAVGADLTLLAGMRDRDDVLAVARQGHRAFGLLGELGVPTFAFVNGAAMGGGLELALHCTYRSAAVSARGLGLPEVSLGIVPAWGGAWLLPHLAGPAHAVRVVVENPLAQNRLLDACTAHELGIVDVVLADGDFLARSLHWCADVVRGRQEVRRSDVRRDAGAWATAVAHGRSVADARTRGVAPAAYRALDLIESARVADRAEGFAAEDEALADLVLGPQAQASLYAFDLVRRRSRHPAGAPDPQLARPVTQVGVVGSGLMGRQLALLVAGRLKVPVVLCDREQALVDAGVEAVCDEVDTLEDRGVFDADKANRVRALVSGSTEWTALADCDLVIEAVHEDLAVKQEVVAALDSAVRPETVVATNTSALSMAEVAESSAYPERVVGMHFFNPVAVMPLVEVVRTPVADDAAVATAFAVVAGLSRTGVACSDSPGFVVTRVLGSLLTAALDAVEDGTPAQDVEDAVRALGLPTGPFQLLDLVGTPVAHSVAATLAAAFPDRFHESGLLDAITDAGPVPLTSEAEGRVVVAAEVDALVRGGADSPARAEQVQDRVLRAIAAEVRAMLSDRVVEDARDVDLALLLGAGWPSYLGGITPELARRGLL